MCNLMSAAATAGVNRSTRLRAIKAECISAQLAGLLLVSATFFLIRLNSKSIIEPIVAALVVAFNPIAYAASFTFMTDILFSALMTISTLLYIASLKRGSVLLAVVGTIVALAATLSRQLGLCLPIAYLIVRLLPPSNRVRKSALCSIPLLVCAASLLLCYGWLRATGGVVILKSPLRTLGAIYYNLITVPLYLGLFSVPVLLLTTRPTVVTRVQSSVRWIPFVTALAAVVLALIGMIGEHRIMPFGRNVLIPQGIGPLTLRDTYILQLDNVPSLPPLFWIAVTVLSLWGMFELTGRFVTYAINTIFTRRQFEPRELGALFTGTAILAYFTPLMLVSMYDRYFIPVLPLTLLFLVSISAARPVRRYRAVTATILCVLTAIFAVLGAHDYMAWNRARWTAITDLQKAGIAGPANLDGGFEFNGLFSYDRYVQSADKSWWWVNKDDYQITFGPIEGLKIIKQYAYETWLPPAKRFILVLSK